MFEKMATRGGGKITITFEDELEEKEFINQFKTEKFFLEYLPDEFNESSEELSFCVPSPRTIVTRNSLSAEQITKISSPTKERFGLYMMDLLYT